MDRHRQTDTDRQMNRQADEQTDEQTQTDTNRHRRTDGQTDEWTDEQTDEQTDRQMNRQMNRQPNRQANRQRDRGTGQVSTSICGSIVWYRQTLGYGQTERQGYSMYVLLGIDKDIIYNTIARMYCCFYRFLLKWSTAQQKMLILQSLLLK